MREGESERERESVCDGGATEEKEKDGGRWRHKNKKTHGDVGK